MNKLTKGSIAAGVGVVLLLGGAGSLAYWNDNAGLTGANISTGELTLNADECSWSQNLDLWVPGDEASCETVIELVAAGDNVQGLVAINSDSITVTPAEAADQFDIDFVMGAASVSGGDGQFDHESGTFAGTGTYSIPVTITVSFPYEEGSEQNASQNAAVDLSDVFFEVTQTPATGAVTTP